MFLLMSDSSTPRLCMSFCVCMQLCLCVHAAVPGVCACRQLFQECVHTDSCSRSVCTQTAVPGVCACRQLFQECVHADSCSTSVCTQTAVPGVCAHRQLFQECVHAVSKHMKGSKERLLIRTQTQSANG